MPVNDHQDRVDGCGCIRGQTLCPVAETLWADAQRLYRASALDAYSDESWEAYQAGRRRYDRHFKRQAAA